MKKWLQKTVLLIAVFTVVGHTIFPHFHQDEIPLANHHHYDEQRAGNHPHDEDKSSPENQHPLFSFIHLDENYVPANGQAKNFELPLTFIAELSDISHLNFSAITKTHFGCYKVFPPPKRYFSSSSHRGPPAA